FLNLLWREEAFHRIATEDREGRLVEIGLHQRPFFKKDFLDGAQEADLVRVVVMDSNKALERALNYLGVIGQRLQRQHVPEKGQKVIDLQAVDLADIGRGHVQLTTG